MSSSTLSPLRLGEMVKELHRRAPASVMTIASLTLTYLVTKAYEDYSLFKALGQGGLGKPSLLTWLVHAFVLRPLAMPARAVRDAGCLPFDDDEWSERTSNIKDVGLEAMPKRSEPRPLMFGTIPHRQLEHVNTLDSDMQKAIIAHLQYLAEQHPDALTLAMSTYEATTSPCLFVQHGGASSARPTALSRLYLSGTPSPMRAYAEGDDAGTAKHLPHDPTKHELAHIHLSEGSLHVTLAPQDARKVLEKEWGELHPLAGLAYRGHWLPPFWLPAWTFGLLGGEQQARWAYQRRFVKRNAHDPSALRGKLVPPTYTSIYTPQTHEQLEWTLRIIDASVAWAIGKPLG